jgi:putative ABC transport system ATP-binding protein
MDESAIVSAINLVKTYLKGQNEVIPLNGVSLNVSDGEFLAIMGPSGSGKTTLLNVLGALDKPDSGDCFLEGVDITRMKESDLCSFRAENIGFIFQAYNLIPVLSAGGNVEIPLRLFPLSAKRRREQVETALDIVGLTGHADHLPSQLSGGQEQRVAIARAIVTDPKIILADEPTGNLDEDSGSEIVDILRRLATEQNKTIVMVTHDATNAQIADRVLYFDHGVLAEKSSNH